MNKIIKKAVDEFLKKEREDIIAYEEQIIAEEDWRVEAMETLEGNQ